MKYGSVCSGIEAATVAFTRLGWKPAWFSEIDPFCRELLKHYYPKIKNHGDFTTIRRAWLKRFGYISLTNNSTLFDDKDLPSLANALQIQTRDRPWIHMPALPRMTLPAFDRVAARPRPGSRRERRQLPRREWERSTYEAGTESIPADEPGDR